MSWKRSSVSMPMTQAGIMSVGSDTELEGIKIGPKALVIGVTILVVMILILGKLIKFQ